MNTSKGSQESKPLDDPPRRLRIAINTRVKRKADLQTDKAAAWSLSHEFQVMDLSVEELAERIRNRENIANICLDSNGQYHRKKEYFKRGDIVGVDVDNDSKSYLSLTDALENPFVKAHATIIYTTASHKPEHHKFRLLFALQEPITDRVRYEKIVGALIWKFRSDESCKDASRFFYGAGEGGQVIALDNRLTNIGIDALLIEHELAIKKEREQWPERDRADFWNAFTPDSDKAEDRRYAYARRAIEQASRIIDESVPPTGDTHGNRHNARTRAAYLLGGYVAGGLLTHSEAHDALATAVSRNTRNFSSAMETIDDCLEAGKSAPITFEQLEVERRQWIGEHQPKVEPTPKTISAVDKLKERRAVAEALREIIRASADVTDGQVEREISECVDMLNFIRSRARCPMQVWEFVLAIIGVVQEKTREGHENDWFEANDYDIGKRLRGDEDDKVDQAYTRKELKEAAKREGLSVAAFRAVYDRRRTERIKLTARRRRALCNEWQKKTGYIFVESDPGGKKGREKHSTRYRVPVLTEAAESLVIARDKRNFAKNPKKAIKLEAKNALGRLEGTFVKRDRFNRPGRDAQSVFLANDHLIITKIGKNLRLAVERGLDPVEYVERLFSQTISLLRSLGFSVDEQPLHTYGENKNVGKNRAHSEQDIRLWDALCDGSKAGKSTAIKCDAFENGANSSQNKGISSNSLKNFVHKRHDKALNNQQDSHLENTLDVHSSDSTDEVHSHEDDSLEATELASAND